MVMDLLFNILLEEVIILLFVLSFEILLNVGISTFVLIPRICPSFVFTEKVAFSENFREKLHKSARWQAQYKSAI